MFDIKQVLKDKGYSVTAEKSQNEMWFKGKGIELVIIIVNGKYRAETHKQYIVTSISSDNKEHFISRLKYNF